MPIADCRLGIGNWQLAILSEEGDGVDVNCDSVAGGEVAFVAEEEEDFLEEVGSGTGEEGLGKNVPGPGGAPTGARGGAAAP